MSKAASVISLTTNSPPRRAARIFVAEHGEIDGGQEDQRQHCRDKKSIHDSKRHRSQNTVGAIGIKPSTVETAVSVNGEARSARL
jgi:hypothetical protein